MKRPEPPPKQPLKKSPLAMKSTINRVYLKPNAGTSVFVAVDLTASAASAAGRVRNIALAVDTSGSMDGLKMQQAKDAALSLVKQLRPTDMISVVSFSDNVKLELATSQVGNGREAAAAINGMKVWGLTAMYDGLELAAKQARAAIQEPGTVSRVLLMTDGNPTVGKTDDRDFIGLAKAVREGGCTITAVGIGNDYNDSLMTKIAENGGGVWHHIKEGKSDLSQLFQEQAAQMASTIVSNPELKIWLMPGAELADAYSVKPVLNKLARPKLENGIYTIPLKDLVAGQDQVLVFRIGVSGKQMGKTRLLRFGMVEVVQDVEVTFTDDPKAYNTESNPYPRTLLSSVEATVLIQRAVQSGDKQSLQAAETVMKTIAGDAGATAATRANPVLSQVVSTMRDAQATVARSGLNLNEGAKKDFLQETTIIGKKRDKR